MKARVFLAQALDNTLQDHVQSAEGSCELTTQERAQAVASVSAISSAGSVLFSRDGVKLFARGNFAVLQVIAEERDQQGRLAPVVCSLEHTPNAGSVEELWQAMERFAESIGRSFSACRRQAALEALNLFAKKPVARGCLGLFLPVVAIGGIAFLLSQIVRVNKSR